MGIAIGLGSGVEHVALAEIHLCRDRSEVGLHVRHRLFVVVRSELEGDDPSGRTHRACQGDRERPGAGARLQHAGAGKDVGEHEDRSDVLGIDDLRAARHLQDEVGEPGAVRRERRPGR